MTDQVARLEARINLILRLRDALKAHDAASPHPDDWPDDDYDAIVRAHVAQGAALDELLHQLKRGAYEELKQRGLVA